MTKVGDDIRTCWKWKESYAATFYSSCMKVHPLTFHFSDIRKILSSKENVNLNS